jgi:sulfate adenylyltransferase
LVYLAGTGRYVPEDQAPPGAPVLAISGTELRRRLADGEELPDWFMPPEVAAVLRRSYPRRPAVPVRIGDALLTADAVPAEEDQCARA